MANLSVLLNATISVTDTVTNPNPTPITRNLNNPTLAVTTAVYEPFLIVGAAPVVLTLPAATIFIAYIKNLHATNNVLVTWTPNGGVSVSAGIVAPGGVMMYFQATEAPGSAVSGVSNGLTAITLTASAATTPVEILLAA